jgi:hypothetical protein
MQQQFFGQILQVMKAVMVSLRFIRETQADEIERD